MTPRMRKKIFSVSILVVATLLLVQQPPYTGQAENLKGKETDSLFNRDTICDTFKQASEIIDSIKIEDEHKIDWIKTQQQLILNTYYFSKKTKQ